MSPSIVYKPSMKLFCPLSSPAAIFIHISSGFLIFRLWKVPKTIIKKKRDLD
ncbi:MAG: hypothetical protein ACW96X_04025 [Promethearchaeota archaeon]